MLDKLKFIFFVLCIAPLIARGENIDPRIYKHDVCGFYAMLHINGVDTDQPGAARNLQELATAQGNALDGHQMRYGLAYSRTKRLSLDIVESMAQTMASFAPNSVSFEDWIRAYYRAIFPDWFPPEAMIQLQVEVAKRFDIARPDASYDPEVYSILNDTYRWGFINKTAKLLIVGHSQGTVYANIIYRKMISQPWGGYGGSYQMLPRQVGLMSIAAFVESLEGTGSLHVTNENDRPVTMGRWVYQAILGHTVTIPHTEPWNSMWRGHNLINKYLADPASRDQIVYRMQTVLRGLRYGFDDLGPQDIYGPAYFNSVQWGGIYCSPATPCTVNTGTGHVTMTGPYMVWQIPGTLNFAAQQGSQEDARLKAIENAPLCIPVMVERERKIRLRIPIAWNDYSAGGCWTGVHSMYQAWNIHSSAASTPIAEWDRQTSKWVTRVPFICPDPSS